MTGYGAVGLPITFIADNTPVIIGVGQSLERLSGLEITDASSPQQMASEAGRLALADSGKAQQLGAAIDAIAVVRLFADSLPPALGPLFAPFGASDNMPRSIAQRLNLSPGLAIYSPACGDEPQHLLAEMCERIARGEIRAAMVCGAETIATQRQAQKTGLVLDWREAVDGNMEDRGLGIEGLVSPEMVRHQLQMPASVYPLFDHARRARLGLSKAQYNADIGHLFSRFSAIAAGNPYSMFDEAISASEISETTNRNRMIADPYTRAMVAKDGVNQGAAVIVCNAGTAREMGIPDARWVFMHGYSRVEEQAVLAREDLGASPAMTLAYQAALAAAEKTAADIAAFDLYSCFPIAVFTAMDALDLQLGDERPLTMTGGLPFFGGPGNNYSLHGLASMVDYLRLHPASFGVVGANGGNLSKHAVGVYSTTPKAFTKTSSKAVQSKLDGLTEVPLTLTPEGLGHIETYTVLWDKNGPSTGIIVGRLAVDNRRFVANTSPGDTETLAAMNEGDPLHRSVLVEPGEAGNRFRFAK